MFFLLIGISSTIGSIGHGTHHQFGISFFNVVLFLMNAVSLIAIYYCFKAAYSLTTTLKSNNKLKRSNKTDKSSKSIGSKRQYKK